MAINIALSGAQVLGGLFSGSLALFADALHNFSDAMSLVIAVLARRIARRPADAHMTFGYGRAEVVAALINYTTLILLGLYLIYEAILRVFAPQPVVGWTVVIVAGLALVIDLATAALTYAMAKDSVNIRAAFLHNLADALGSVAVILAGTLVILYGWHLVDPLATLMIAGYILWMSFSEIGPVIRILMLGSPPDMDTEAVLAAVRATEGVAAIHHAHLWLMQEHGAALDLHVVIDPGAWERAEIIKAEVRRRLKDEFDIHHGIIEIESAEHRCADTELFGQ